MVEVVTEGCCAVFAFLKGFECPANLSLVYNHASYLISVFFFIKIASFPILQWKFCISSEHVLSLCTAKEGEKFVLYTEVGQK